MDKEEISGSKDEIRNYGTREKDEEVKMKSGT